MGAYEALCLQRDATFKRIADRFRADPEAVPSDFVSPTEANTCASQVMEVLKADGIDHFGIRIHHAGDYPERLRHAKNPVELLYYRGGWELTETRCVAIVGSRKASSDGKERAKRLARELVENDFTIVSGLAAGIDTAAHTSAISSGGRTISVVGTSLGRVYPQENAALQERIATQHLLISQVPVLRYRAQSPRHNRFFFPERNKTMSALTEATIIVEASETSGTLTQARAALFQGRRLFILNSCFERSDITWPHRFAEQGAIRVRKTSDVIDNLADH